MACQVRVPEIKYSGLISEHASPVAWVARFEDWLSETLPGVRVVRLDELLRLEWEVRKPVGRGRRYWTPWCAPALAAVPRVQTGVLPVAAR